eukprot:Opistho-2@56105
MASTVGGFAFGVLPRWVGKWHGDRLAIIDHQDQQTTVCTVKFAHDPAAGEWLERRTVTDHNGVTTTSHFRVRPIGNGVAEMSTDSPNLEKCEMRIVEQDHSVATIYVVDRESGRLVSLETVTLTGANDDRRTRVIQRFDDNGQLVQLFAAHEGRNRDATTPASDAEREDSGPVVEDA